MDSKHSRTTNELHEKEEEEEEIYFSKQFTVIQLVTNQYIDIYYHRHI